MQINAVGANSPSFGMKCPPRVKASILGCMTSDGPSFFKNADRAAEKIDSIGSSSTRLSAVRFIRDFWDNGEGAGMKDLCWLTFKMKSPNGKMVTLRRAVVGYPEKKKDLFKELFKATKNAEKEFINNYLTKQASRGQLDSASANIEALYRNHRGFIAHRTQQLRNVNNFAQEVKKQASTIKDFLFKLFR